LAFDRWPRSHPVSTSIAQRSLRLPAAAGRRPNSRSESVRRPGRSLQIGRSFRFCCRDRPRPKTGDRFRDRSRASPQSPPCSRGVWRFVRGVLPTPALRPIGSTRQLGIRCRRRELNPHGPMATRFALPGSRRASADLRFSAWLCDFATSRSRSTSAGLGHSCCPKLPHAGCRFFSAFYRRRTRVAGLDTSKAS
jgi:hypothetical protein